MISDLQHTMLAGLASLCPESTSPLLSFQRDVLPFEKLLESRPCIHRSVLCLKIYNYSLFAGNCRWTLEFTLARSAHLLPPLSFSLALSQFISLFNLSLFSPSLSLVKENEHKRIKYWVLNCKCKFGNFTDNSGRLGSHMTKFKELKSVSNLWMMCKVCYYKPCAFTVYYGVQNVLLQALCFSIYKRICL